MSNSRPITIRNATRIACFYLKKEKMSEYPHLVYMDKKRMRAIFIECFKLVPCDIAERIEKAMHQYL